MKKRYLLIPAFAVLFILLIGPWPIDDTPYTTSNYAQTTLSKLQSISPRVDTGELQANFAQTEITPAIGVPLGGYSARDPKENKGARSRLTAQAISFSNSSRMVTLVNAEILLPLPDLIKHVLQKTQLQREDLYFTVTHTHSGPGGYGKTIVQEMALGEFNQDYFNQLVDRLSQVILESRNNLKSVSLQYKQIELEEDYALTFIRNQLNDGKNTHTTIHTLKVIEQPSQTQMLELITFSAHPTFFGRDNLLASGDYPGNISRIIANSLQTNVMFVVGAVGAMKPISGGRSPSTDLSTQIKQLKEFSERFANLIIGIETNPQIITDNNGIKRIKTVEFSRATLQSVILPVNLPSPSYVISEQFRLSPFLIESLFHEPETYIHALRLGKLIFLGQPADYSGELALALERGNDKQAIFPWVTSFNGDYVGYLVPSARFDEKHYITRGASFFGRWSGDYFHYLNQTIIKQLFP